LQYADPVHITLVQITLERVLRQAIKLTAPYPSFACEHELAEIYPHSKITKGNCAFSPSHWKITVNG